MANAQKISDSRVMEKTGKSWEEWFTFFDRFENDNLIHKELVKLLHDNFSLSPWWRQMIVVTYEKDKKGRNDYQYKDGYRITVSKLIDASLPTLYNLWSDKQLRNTWFPLTSYTVVTEKSRKCIRMIWSDTLSVVEITFTSLLNNRSRLSIEHRRLLTQESAEEMKVFWNRSLERLYEMVSADQFHSVIQDM